MKGYSECSQRKGKLRFEKIIFYCIKQMVFPFCAINNEPNEEGIV